jgi:glycerophosphoryl diester phosphodiesterase
MQCCLRYNANTANGVEISQRTVDNTWSVLSKGSTTKHASGGYNVVKVSASNINTSFYINGTEVLKCANTSFSNGCWGFQVRGLTMTLDYVRLGFRSNYTSSTLYTVPGGIADVRDPSTGISTAPALITEVKTTADLENILNGSPAIAIMNYDVVSGSGRIVFSDGYTTPDAAINKLGAKVIPAFRVSDTSDVDSLVSFMKGRNLRDAFAISSELSLLKRAYNGWKYLRGVADYSAYGSFDPETIRYNALANGARVMILPESTPRDTVTKLQDSYASVWLPVGEGKTASVAGINMSPYGLITPDRGTTEYCYQNYYGANTLIRKTNIIGHRGVLSLMPENTILGAQTAYQNGANMVENDIYLTADGVVVVMHDQTIDRTTNGSGQVVNMTSNQLKQYKVDYHTAAAPQPIPTLEDYFKLIKGQAGQKLVIEMKHPYDARLANAMVSMIKKYDILDQVVVMSFIQQNIANTSAALPGAPVGWLNRLALDESNPLKVTSDILENIQPYNSVFNPEYLGWGNSVIKDQAYRGITLWPWTVNKRDQFDKLFINGIAGITTDYCQWGKNYIESIHWNSASRVISSTYQDVLTDITNSCEVVVIEDTLGITCSAGNIIVPQKPEGGKASFYYRYRSTTATGTPYYTVTEIRTIVVPSTYTLTLQSSSSLKISGSYLTKVSDSYTASSLAAQFKYPVEVLDADGAVMSNFTRVGTGCVVRLKSDHSRQVTVIIRGDADGDGRLNSTDYLLLKSCFLKETELSGPYLKAADCNEDGVLDSTDYLKIKAHFLNKVYMFD